MAVIKRKNKYQSKLRDSGGKWITRTFATKKEAQQFEIKVKQEILKGSSVTQEASRLTCDEYFERWFTTVEYQASPGWRKEQRQLWRDYGSPVLGGQKLDRVAADQIARVLAVMAKKGLSEQTRLHAYGLLRKLFRDAVELFHLLPKSPVHRSLKPKIPVREARHLDLEQTRLLLGYVRDKEYGLAIWLQLYLGLRVGELQALTWADIDQKNGVVHIRRTYVRKERRIRDYPKGRRQHSHRIPAELLTFLKECWEAGDNLAHAKFVVTDTRGEMLSYEWYHRSLKRYCKALKLPEMGTHSLRHSMSELYLSHGATPYDLQALFAHSSLDVTERYVHNRGRNLDRVSNVIQLFPNCSQLGTSG